MRSTHEACRPRQLVVRHLRSGRIWCVYVIYRDYVFTRGKCLPTASKVSVQETLDLLDGPFSAVAESVSQGGYTFWLGSGISRGRVIGLDGVLAKLIEFLRTKVTPAPGCIFRSALDTVVGMAGLTAMEMTGVDYGTVSTNWPCLKTMIDRLWNQYSAVLSVEIPGEALDFLLWHGLDFKNTFASQSPDVEHLSIGILVLEGVVSDLATANWDGLLEGAVRELGYPDTCYQITVTGHDLRGPTAAAVLFKFHGCALRAIADETHYRKRLIARSAQIVSWMNNAEFAITRTQLTALLQRKRTLMIGMSAQDVNIQDLFGAVGAQNGWEWNSSPTPIVFSAQDLSEAQKTILQVAYGENNYEQHRTEICDAARLQAYSKPLLLALLLSVVTAKLQILAAEADAPGLDAPSHASIAEGLKALRNLVAAAGNGDRLALVRKIALCISRARNQLQDGTSPAGALRYYPIDNEPAHRMRNKLSLAATGQREAASALGLIGLEVGAGSWSPAVDDPKESRSGALRLNSPAASARVFFASNDDNITSLIECGAIQEDDEDVVLICSKRVSARQQRSPSPSLRTGSIGPRYIAFGPMLAAASDLAALRDRFREEVAL
jgi:hypothetical protein